MRQFRRRSDVALYAHCAALGPNLKFHLERDLLGVLECDRDWFAIKAPTTHSQPANFR